MDLDIHLSGIVAGDPDAFAGWVAGAEARLRDSLRPLAARVDTESVLQEALLRVWQVAPRFVPDGKPDGLLRLAVRVARNLAIDEIRRTHAPTVGLEALDNLADPVSPTGNDPLLRQLIAICKGKLAGQPALALAARLASGGADPDEHLAAQLGMRVNTFLQNIARARRALVECLRRSGVELETSYSEGGGR